MEKDETLNKESKKSPVTKKKVVRKSSKARLALLNQYREHAIDNEIEIVQSNQCGCFFCRHVFDARDVQDWMDGEHGVTALCPECGMDAVIGDASGIEIDKPLMKEMNLAFYGETYMQDNPEAARTYCIRYIDGKIAHKAKSEALFLHYLSILEQEGDANASLALGEFYRLGGDFAGRDLNLALSHFEMPSLSAHPHALCAAGAIRLEKMDDPLDTSLAFEDFAKASALGSVEASYYLADCYLHGYFVNPDPNIAARILENAYDTLSHRFAIERNGWFEFPEVAYRLGLCYQKGLGVKQDEEWALRFFLHADLAMKIRQNFLGQDHESKMAEDLAQRINAIALSHNLSHNEIVYDADTFEDSVAEMGESLEERTIENVSFDPDGNELSFDMVCPSPCLITDIGNLSAAFITGPITWHLKDVASYKISSENKFTNISGDYDSGFKFFYTNDDGDDVTVLEIYFARDPSNIEVTDKK